MAKEKEVRELTEEEARLIDEGLNPDAVLGTMKVEVPKEEPKNAEPDETPEPEESTDTPAE